jgi:DNA-binding MarR family transcriptional regulator
MSYVLSEKAQAILAHLQANVGTDETFVEVAEATGLEARSVNGTVTGLAKRGLVERVEVEGFDKKVIRLTDAGRTFDPMTEKVEADAE